jgi:hypothetical protein
MGCNAANERGFPRRGLFIENPGEVDRLRPGAAKKSGAPGVSGIFDPLIRVLLNFSFKDPSSAADHNDNSRRDDERDAERNGDMSGNLGPIHKSSRRPLKNGCRT